MSDLFSRAAEADARKTAPLAERMRPRSLEEVVGQRQLLGPKALFRRLVEKDQLPSAILWGPPGTGKTTLARVVAGHSRAHFEALSAVLSGVADLRKVLAAAEERRNLHRERTVLFVDEIHRWSKSQQDALLKAVEEGIVRLIGATTENPSFELNSALLSRARVFVLERLDEAGAMALVLRALEDPERGVRGAGRWTVEDGAMELLLEVSNGDARHLLTSLEMATGDVLAQREQEGEPLILTRASVEAVSVHRPLLYDKAGDEHFGVISAFIKAMRGSDPDAAVYYLVRMLEAGEDPRFLCRRLVIFASEDVGLADPRALSVAVDAHRAYELVGLPEGVLPLTQATVYLSLAPKSNTALSTYAAARKLVRARGSEPVPPRLLNATSKLTKAMGHGEGYRYPHDFGGILPGESHLPDALVGEVLYRPSDNGEEAEMVRAHQARGNPSED